LVLSFRHDELIPEKVSSVHPPRTIEQ